MGKAGVGADLAATSDARSGWPGALASHPAGHHFSCYSSVVLRPPLPRRRPRQGRLPERGHARPGPRVLRTGERAKLSQPPRQTTSIIILRILRRPWHTSDSANLTRQARTLQRRISRCGSAARDVPQGLGHQQKPSPTPSQVNRRTLPTLARLASPLVAMCWRLHEPGRLLCNVGRSKNSLAGLVRRSCPCYRVEFRDSDAMRHKPKRSSEIPARVQGGETFL